MGRRKKGEQLTGIELLLDGYTEMRMTYDYDALVICLDLEQRLQSDILKPSDRQTIALCFFAGLSKREVANVLDIEEKAVEKRVDEWRERWAHALIGDGTSVSQRVTPGLHISIHPDINQWNDDILYNRNRWWIVPTSVRVAILELFGTKQKSNRKQYIRKRRPYYMSKCWNEEDVSGRPEWEVLMREVEDKPTTHAANHKRAANGEMGELYDDHDTYGVNKYPSKRFDVRLSSERLGPMQLACLAGPVKKFYIS